MRKIFLVPIGILTFSLLGCATPYQRAGFRGGYIDYPINEQTYQITFRGNAYTSSDKVQEYLLYRASELTIANGYKYFIIENSADNVESGDMQVTPTQVHSTSMGNVYATQSGHNVNGQFNGTTNTSISPGAIYHYNKHTMRIVIQFTNEKSHMAYDAQLINSNFKSDIN